MKTDRVARRPVNRGVSPSNQPTRSGTSPSSEAREVDSSNNTGPREKVYAYHAAAAFGTTLSKFRRDLIKTRRIRSTRSGKLTWIYRDELDRALADPALDRFKYHTPAGCTPLNKVANDIGMYPAALLRIAEGNTLSLRRLARNWLGNSDVEALREVRSYFSPSRRYKTVDRYTAVRIIGTDSAVDQHIESGHLIRPSVRNTGERFDLFSVLLLRVRRERGLVPRYDEENAKANSVPFELLSELAHDAVTEIRQYEAKRETVTICESARAFGITARSFREHLIDTAIIPAAKHKRGARIFRDNLEAALADPTLAKYRRNPPPNYEPLHLLADELTMATANLHRLCVAHGVPLLDWGRSFITIEERDALRKAFSYFRSEQLHRVIDRENAVLLLGGPAILEFHETCGHLPPPTDTATGLHYRVLSILLLRIRRERNLVQRKKRELPPEKLLPEERFADVVERGDLAFEEIYPTIHLGHAARQLGISIARFRTKILKPKKLKLVRDGTKPTVYAEDFARFLESDTARKLARVAPPGYVTVAKVRALTGVGNRALVRLAHECSIPLLEGDIDSLDERELEPIQRAVKLNPDNHRRRVIDRITAALIVGTELALDLHVEAKHLAPIRPSRHGDGFELLQVLLLRYRRELGVVSLFDAAASRSGAVPHSLLPLVVTCAKYHLPGESVRGLLGSFQKSGHEGTEQVDPRELQAIQEALRATRSRHHRFMSEKSILEAGEIVGSQMAVSMHEGAGHIQPILGNSGRAKYERFALHLLQARRKYGILPRLEQGENGETISRDEALRLLDTSEVVLDALTRSHCFSNSGDPRRPYFKAEIVHYLQHAT